MNDTKTNKKILSVKLHSVDLKNKNWKEASIASFPESDAQNVIKMFQTRFQILLKCPQIGLKRYISRKATAQNRFWKMVKEIANIKKISKVSFLFFCSFYFNLIFFLVLWWFIVYFVFYCNIYKIRLQINYWKEWNARKYKIFFYVSKVSDIVLKIDFNLSISDYFFVLFQFSF